ncbi:hypothetical protein C8R45DRAFT_1131288 [Mycena sanguinolenta]|nr:hypothetical protein C8R45DRAFT_1131288 [Mycena sanguinolenta]
MNSASEAALEEALDLWEVFLADMARWVIKQFSAFDVLHEAGGDVLALKKAKLADFEKEFGDARCNEIPDFKNKFKRKFHNHAKTLRANDKSSGPSRAKPFYLLPEAPETKARDLYKSAHRDEFSEEASKRNQKDLARTLLGVLQGILHAGRGGSGVGAFHVLYAYRNAEEKLIVGSLSVNSGNTETVPFQTACTAYESTTEVPWEQYAHQNIGFNNNVDYSNRFSKNAGGFYVLPVFDDETGTIQDYRNTIRSFFEASFFQVILQTGSMSAMPWVEFLAHPEDFLDPKLIVVNAILARLDAMPSDELRAFARRIHDFQANNPASSIFNDDHIISAAMLNHKARADMAKLQNIEPDIMYMYDSEPGTPLTSPLLSPHIMPVKPVSPPPPKSKKRKATDPPASATSAPFPLRRSMRQNAPVAPTATSGSRPTKRRKVD